jgi:hypothetical protein
LKNRFGSALTAIILITVVMFLAADVGFSLYNPDRIDTTAPICTLNVIGGNIKVQTKEALTWADAEDGMILEPGSRVMTEADSHASLLFSEGTTTKLEPDTEMIVSKLEGNQDNQPGTVVLKQRTGKTWNQVSKRPDDNGSFRIETSSAEIVVHGTLFSTEVDESGKTLIQTTEGLVNVNARGQAVLVAEGQQTEVEAGAAPSIPAAMPPARNELVFTISEPLAGLVVDPSGSMTGYLADGSPLNQICGSRLSSPEDARNTIRISEPGTGEYSVILHSTIDSDSTVSIEGFAEGQSTFLHTESCNITAANELVLKLHLDVLDGLMPGAAVQKPGQTAAEPVYVASNLKTAGMEAESATSIPEVPRDDKAAQVESENKEVSGEKSPWYNAESAYKLNPWIVLCGVLLLFGVIFTVVWKKV